MTKRRLALVCLGVIGAVGAVAMPARPETRWRMTDLGTLGGGFSLASAINGRGEVVGTSRTRSGTRDVFLWRNGRLADLGRYGWDAWSSFGPAVNERGQVVWVEQGHGSVVWHDGAARRLGAFTAVALNDRGQLAGRSAAGGRALLWENGRLRELGVLAGDHGSEAVALNDSGAVVGSSYGAEQQHAFLWQHGSMRRLASPVGPASCYPVAVNRGGHVLGWCVGEGAPGHAVLWEGNRARDLGESMSPVALNDRGDVVGDCKAKGRWHPCLWHDGRRRDLGTLGGKDAWVAAMNNRGQIVGSSSTGDGKRHAFVWEDGVMLDLGRSGARSTSEALAINDSGQIVGYSQTGEPRGTSSGPPQHAVLWAAGV